VVKDIIELVEQGKIQGLKELRDDSSEEDGIDFSIYLKKEVDPVSIMHTIYAKTNMEKTFPVNFKLISDYQDTDYTIRSFLLNWIDFRRDTKRRLYNHELIKSKERQHILEIILFVLNEDNLERTTTIMKKAENKKEAIATFIQTYSITSLQANIIASMSMPQFTKESRRNFKKEKDEVDQKVEEYGKLVRSLKKIDKMIKDELDEGIKLFGESRRSKVISIDGEVKIRDTNHLVVFTYNGFVKKLSDQCTSIGFINQDDYPIEIIEARNVTDLLIFDETGKISKLPVHLITNSELNSEGDKLNKYCNINGMITTIIPKPTEDALTQVKMPIYFVMITKKGIIKKTMAQHYVNIKNELLGLIVKEEDQLKTVKLLAGDKDIVIYTNKGLGVRISSKEIKETSRMSIGIKALNLSEGEEVIGMDLVNPNDKYLFILTNKGTGKKSPMDAFKTMDRNSKPLRLISLDSDEDVMIVKTVKGTEQFKAYLKGSVEQINIVDVLELPRLSKGRKLIPVRKGEVIIDVKEIKK
jgi:DNA gyrase subunit A